MSEEKGHSNLGIKQPPSLEDLRRYLAGTLSPAAMAHIAQLLKDDPLLAEALEGLKAAGDDPEVGKSIARLRSRARQRVEPLRKEPKLKPKRSERVKPLVQPAWYLAAAAALAFLALTVVGIWQWRSGAFSESEPLAMTQPVPDAEEEPLPPPVIEIPAAPEESAAKSSSSTEKSAPVARSEQFEETATPGGGLTMQKPREEPPANLSEAIGQEDQSTSGYGSEPVDPAPAGAMALEDDHTDEIKSSGGGEAQVSEEVAISAPAEERIRMGNSYQPDEIEKIPEQQVLAAPAREMDRKYASDDDQKRKKESEAFGVASRDSVLGNLLLLAIREYQRGNWASSLSKSREVLMGQPKNGVAMYYAGMASYQLDDLDQATNYLQAAIKTGDQEILDEAEWKLALLYELEGRDKKARRLLERVANRSGARQKDAQNKLENH